MQLKTEAEPAFEIMLSFSHDYEHKSLLWTDAAFGLTAAPFFITACSRTCRTNVRDSWNGATSFSVLSLSFCDYP
jgi:hypothetical protein